MAAGRVGLSFDDVADLSMRMPEVEQQAHFDQPAYRVRGKILVTLRHDADGTPVAVLKPPLDEIHAATAADPSTYSLASSGWLMVRLPTADRDVVWELLAEAWLRIASKRLAAQHRDTIGPPRT